MNIWSHVLTPVIMCYETVLLFAKEELLFIDVVEKNTTSNSNSSFLPWVCERYPSVKGTTYCSVLACGYLNNIIT